MIDIVRDFYQDNPLVTILCIVSFIYYGINKMIPPKDLSDPKEREKDRIKTENFAAGGSAIFVLILAILIVIGDPLLTLAMIVYGFLYYYVFARK